MTDNPKKKKISAFRKDDPDLLDLLYSEKDKTEWALIISLCKFHLSRIGAFGSNTLSGKWFQRSWAHQILFYRLLLAQCEAVLAEQDSCGVARTELMGYMKQANQESYNTINKILVEGVASGFIKETHWSADARVKIFFLSPQSIKEYFVTGAEAQITALQSSDLPARATLHMEERLKDMPTLASVLEKKWPDKCQNST